MNLTNEWKWLLPLVLVAGLIFANALGGEFVYDDQRQIVRNPLIQDSTLYRKALTSDVWAFKGDGTIVASNYWRPTFVAWLILNFRVFGANPFGWHVLNTVLHAAVCALAYLLLRRWNVSGNLAFAVTLIFAVHPVHTESVAWISGSPDLLFTFALLGSFLSAENWRRRERKRPGKGDFILSSILYAVALGAKEVGILCFPIYWFILTRKAGRSAPNNNPSPSSPGLRFLIYPAVAAAYFVVRWMIIGRISLPREDAVSLGNAILTIPSIFVFYLRQMVFPFWLGANYPLRPITDMNFIAFFLPLLISIISILGLWLVARSSLAQRIGFWLFLLPLLPAMNAGVFPAEQIVHDRYLYLPLLGFLTVIVPALNSLVERLAIPKATPIAVAFAVLASLPLGWQTLQYNRAWLSDVSLWKQTVKIDPTSSFVWSQYGAALAEKKMTREAADAYENALNIRPTPIAYMGEARNLLAQRKYEKAVADLRMVTGMPPEKANRYVLYQTYETLAVVYLEQKKFDDAVNSLEESRRRLPIYYAALTEKLAVILYNQGRKDLALTELEQARDRARTELLPESKAVLLRLGTLYLEQDRKADAKTVLQEYLQLTARLQDKRTMADRIRATGLLRTLN